MTCVLFLHGSWGRLVLWFRDSQSHTQRCMKIISWSCFFICLSCRFFWHHLLIIIPGTFFLHSFLDVQAKGKAIKKETMVCVQTFGDQEEKWRNKNMSLVKTSKGKENEMNKQWRFGAATPQKWRKNDDTNAGTSEEKTKRKMKNKTKRKMKNKWRGFRFWPPPLAPTPSPSPPPF